MNQNLHSFPTRIVMEATKPSLSRSERTKTFAQVVFKARQIIKTRE